MKIIKEIYFTICELIAVVGSAFAILYDVPQVFGLCILIVVILMNVTDINKYMKENKTNG